MTNLFDEVNKGGAMIVASSRSRATEVVQLPDGRLVHVIHLKSGRDILDPISSIPSSLTVRYNPPIPLSETVREFISR